MNATQPIRNISDTALWVASYRAMESARPDALFRDPYAERLAGVRGPEIVRDLPFGRDGAWVLSVRTHVLDEFIRDAVRDSGADAVVNLAAGLDTRPYRLDLPKHLSWIEVDLPDILNYKEGVIGDARPTCHLERVRLDLSDTAGRRALFARLNSQFKKVFVLTEGFLIYLDADQVTSLAEDLRAQPNFQWWAMDYTGSRVLKFLQYRWGSRLKAAHSEMKFAPAIGLVFFERLGWKVGQNRFMIEESFRLNRKPPGAWVWRWIKPLLRQNGGLALLERSSSR